MQRDVDDQVVEKLSDSVIIGQKMDNIVKLYQNFISSNDTFSGSEDESELDDFTFDDDDNDQDILNRFAQTRANQSQRRKSVAENFATILGKFQSSSSASTSNVIDQFVKQHQSSPFNQIPEEVLNTLETLGDEKAAALIMGLIEETEQLEQECPRLIAKEQKAKLDEQIGAIRKRMDDSHQRYLNLLKTLDNLPSFKEKLEIEEYRKVVQKKLEEIQDEENKITELDDKIKTCKEIFNQSLDVTV